MIPDSIVTVSRKPRAGAEARREAFVAAARALFFEQGYAATAMSTVAARVGGSKTTLWSYFPSKEDLFAAVVDDIAEHCAIALSIEFADDEPFAVGLRRFGMALMTTIQSPPIVELQRLVTGEAGRFPELGRVLWERGPGRGKAKLRAFVVERMKRGELRRGDATMATMQFAGMCQSGAHHMHMMGLVPAMTPDECAAIVDAAVDTFMRAWGSTPFPPADR